MLFKIISLYFLTCNVKASYRPVPSCSLAVFLKCTNQFFWFKSYQNVNVKDASDQRLQEIILAMQKRLQTICHSKSVFDVKLCDYK